MRLQWISKFPSAIWLSFVDGLIPSSLSLIYSLIYSAIYSAIYQCGDWGCGQQYGSKYHDAIIHLHLRILQPIQGMHEEASDKHPVVNIKMWSKFLRNGYRHINLAVLDS